MLNRSFRRAARAISALAALAVSCAAVLADDGLDFARVAPAKPAMVLIIPNFTKLHASFESSELGKLWHEPGVQSLIEDMTSEASTQLGEFLKGLGAETKDLKPPTGGVGLAVYLPPPSKDKSDDARGAPAPRLLFGADAGENAATWKDLIEKLVDKGIKDKELASEEDTVAGTKITILRPIYKEAKEKPAPDPMKPATEDEADDGPLEPPQSGFAGFVGGNKDHPQAMSLAWSGTTLLASTDPKSLEHALDALQGKDADSLASDADFKAAVAQHPADTQASVYLNVGLMLSEAFEQALAARAGLGDGEGMPNVGKLMEALGVGQVKFLSAGMRMDTPESVAELSMGVLAPEKKGILALLSEPLGAFDPPGFVPPDAASVMRFSFRFDKIYDLLREVAAALPEAEGKQFTAGLDQSVNLVKPGLDALGPGVSIVGTFKQPLEHDSAMNLIAIDVRDQATVSNTLSFFAGQAQGMAESREFEGNTIYTVEMAQMSVALGFNRLFIGPTAAVENALRLAGRADAPRISAERSFKDATQGFGNDGIVQSFSDTAQALRWQLWTAQNADKAAEAEIDAAGLEPEQKERILKSIRENRPKWLDKLPSIDLLLSHLGDSAAELHPTPDGFRGRSVMLKPAAK